MADRSLRGMRLGAQSLQSEEGVVFSPRINARYRSDDGDIFEVTFAEDAEIPETWTSPKSGKEGVLLSDDGTPVQSAAHESKAPRTHWDMLLERRTRAELEQLLEERLQYLRARRGKQQTIAS
ncbi:RNA polymerase-binding protein RbpA [Naasia sp. SYSU D00948]|uniref:RNA polymerase-binding protein RbpA n=1 Tax=Naasia sp. SYSU D00948 TaxID=2817379 RepID=UPI001B30A9F7|nr:RNA polymerase-binding protein RbpA [Naasia sp. SYSU D00948]